MKVIASAIAVTVRLSAATAEEVVAPLLRLRSQPSRYASSSEGRQQRQGRVAAATSSIGRRAQETDAKTTGVASMSMMSMISMPTLPSAACSFCLGGLSDPDLVLPTDDAATCAMAQAYASTLEVTDPNCAMVALAEALCCAPTIYDLGVSDSNFSTLVSLVDAAGLAEALQGPGPLTLAAPTNDAFAALPQEYMDFLLLPENVEQLQAILLYHVWNGATLSSDIVPGPVQTLNGAYVEAAVTDAGGITLNDANVIVADVPASNGIVHVIDKVLLPPTAADAAPSCACSPVEYNFVITLGMDCGFDSIVTNPGIGQTFCYLGTPTASSSSRRRLASVSLKSDDNGRSLTGEELQMLRQLEAMDVEIVSVQLIEFDTSGELIVINQDNSLSNVSLSNGATVTYASIASDIDPTIPVSDQADLVPGGLQLVVRAKVTNGTTGEVLIVDNRVAWTYTNECGVDPVEAGEGIAWVTLGEHTDAAESSCSAAPVTTTVAPVTTTVAPVTTTDAPVTTTEAASVTTTEAASVTTEAAPVTTEAPVETTGATATPVIPTTPIEIDTGASMSLPTMFGAKSGKSKALKSKAHAKTEKNPMAKVHKSKDNGHVVAPKSGKSTPEIDAKAEKTTPAAKSGKNSKTGYHMFSKGHKMSIPPVESMSM